MRYFIDLRFTLPLILTLVFSGCGPIVKPSLNLPIYFTCDTDGRLEPCGCFIGQYGGLSRIKTVMDQGAPDSLRLDVGDAIAGKEDYDLIEYRYVLNAFAAMNYDALNAGQREAHLTAAQLHSLSDAPVPILSANLIDKATGQPIFQPYRIVSRGAYQVAIIGVVDPRGMEQNVGDGVQIEDMSSAIDRCLDQLRGKVDMTVLLAFTDEATLNQLADRYYEFQVILGGKVRQPAQHLIQENRSIVSYVTNESRTLGMLYLQLQADKPPIVVSNEVRLVRDDVPQDPSIAKMVVDYRQKVRVTKLAVDDTGNLSADMVPNVRIVANYVGTESCMACHKTAAAVWKNSAHSQAFASLMNRGADADPTCVTCHTVGFGDPSGYHRAYAETKLVNVGCESCHGPGSLHVQEKMGNTSIHFTFRPLEAGDCMACHHGEFSRPFNWDQFWPVIRHGKEPVK